MRLSARSLKWFGIARPNIQRPMHVRSVAWSTKALISWNVTRMQHTMMWLSVAHMSVADFTFMSRPAMKLHFRVVHQQMKDFKCRHCQKDFAYKNVLGRHIRNVHKLEPPPEDLEPSRSSGSDGLQWACLRDSLRLVGAGNRLGQRDGRFKWHVASFALPMAGCLDVRREASLGELGTARKMKLLVYVQ